MKLSIATSLLKTPAKGDLDRHSSYLLYKIMFKKWLRREKLRMNALKSKFLL
jgi:hypothetical protein